MSHLGFEIDLDNEMFEGWTYYAMRRAIWDLDARRRGLYARRDQMTEETLRHELWRVQQARERALRLVSVLAEEMRRQESIRRAIDEQERVASHPRTVALRTLEGPIQRWLGVLERQGSGFDPTLFPPLYATALSQLGLQAQVPRDAGLSVTFLDPNSTHRRMDRMARARVRIVIEDNAWFSMPWVDSKESPELCQLCTHDDIEAWFLTKVDGRSPYDVVAAEFEKAERAAKAHWINEHMTEAVKMFGLSEDQLRAAVAPHLVKPPRPPSTSSPRGRGSRPSAPTTPAKPKMSPAETIAFLERIGVPADATVRAAWDSARDVSGCPSKDTVTAAQAVRSGRARRS